MTTSPFRATASLWRIGLVGAALCLGAAPGASRAGTLWYNGVPDGSNAAYNAVVPAVQQGLVYGEFIVPASQTWTITGVFSDNAMNTTTTSAYWEIRQGVSTGQGGTLLDSGTDPATQRDLNNTVFGYEEYEVSVSGLSGITLGPGTYWLTVAPVVAGDQFVSDILTTSGTQAIGMPQGNDGNSYVDGSFYTSQNGGNNFEPAGDYATNGNGLADFSMGVVGYSTPEPSSRDMVLGALAVLAARYGVSRWRRKPLANLGMGAACRRSNPTMQESSRPEFMKS